MVKVWLQLVTAPRSENTKDRKKGNPPKPTKKRTQKTTTDDIQPMAVDQAVQTADITKDTVTDGGDDDTAHDTIGTRPHGVQAPGLV